VHRVFAVHTENATISVYSSKRNIAYWADRIETREGHLSVFSHKEKGVLSFAFFINI